MIYVSTSCIKSKKIIDSVLKLAQSGFKNIELSGGTEYYDGFENDLINLKKEFDLNYLIHNYFPPPLEHFVLNLASTDKDIYEKSLSHYKKAIQLAEKLNISKFGIHAGYLFDPRVKDLGQIIAKNKMYNRANAIDNFCSGYNELVSLSKSVEIYVENNVVSYYNYQNFGKNPFLLTDIESFNELKEYIDFPLLLDLAHLKVSCNTLNLNFKEQALGLINVSNYIHLSDNNSKIDSNNTINADSDIFKLLKTLKLTDKTITLEIYETIDQIKRSNELINKITFDD
tara:strand:+ start:1104 stop:1958 length:855 start_codon:yes stop_codon:yes gene_type:complete